MIRVFWVSVDYFTAGIIARGTTPTDKEAIIIDAAPIIRWMEGKKLSEVRPWLVQKKAKVIELKTKDTNI